MSLLNAIKVRLGISPTQSNNFVLDASAADGTMKLARANNQDVLTVDAAGVLDAVAGLKKGGSVVQALSDFTGTNVSLTPNGYQKLPSGLIIQWGRKESGSAPSITVNFPIAFPNSCFCVNATADGINPGADIAAVHTISTVSFTIETSTPSVATNGRAWWIALGY